jgi:hypothetical protein
MISRERCYCEVRETVVHAYVEEARSGRGAKRVPGERTPVACAESTACARTAFCRFVNPLTTRNPLRPESPADSAASAPACGTAPLPSTSG